MTCQYGHNILQSVRRSGLLLPALLFLLPQLLTAQLPREAAADDRPIGTVFQAPSLIGLATVEQMPSRNLNSSVKHTFGLIRGGIDRFYGLDDGANTRLGLDYGISDRFSVGISRMTFHKVVDIRAQHRIMRQMSSDDRPLDVSLKVSMGASTLSGTGMSFRDRTSYLATLMIARTMGRFSLQLSPMAGTVHTLSGGDKPLLGAVGILGALELSDRYTLGAEYVPRFGDLPQGTSNAMAVSLNIDTGGHIFQLFLSSSQWDHESYIMANNRDRFWEGDIRFGFNIHRVFGL